MVASRRIKIAKQRRTDMYKLSFGCDEKTSLFGCKEKKPLIYDLTFVRPII